MIYADRLEAAVRRTGNPCLVGLDPHLELLPPEFAAARDPAASRAERAAAVTSFLLEVIDVAAGRVPAVKPQSAFFELLGPAGAQAWETVVEAAHAAGLLVIGDVKRSDIGSTAAAYATAFLEGLPGSNPSALCDAVTVNPLLGSESIQPFLDVCARGEKGLYVLVRTSNPGSDEFQAQGSPSLSERIADAVVRWGEPLVGECGMSSVGAVVGATLPGELAELRARMPRTPLLLPGYGAQGAGAADVAHGFLDGGRGALVNSSRAVLFAYRNRPGVPWKDATREALEAMIEALGAPLGQSTGSG